LAKFLSAGRPGAHRGALFQGAAARLAFGLELSLQLVGAARYFVGGWLGRGALGSSLSVLFRRFVAMPFASASANSFNVMPFSSIGEGGLVPGGGEPSVLVGGVGGVSEPGSEFFTFIL